MKVIFNLITYKNMKDILFKIFFPFVNNKYELENKWWHRLFKIIFIIILILSLLFFCWYFDYLNIKYLSLWQIFEDAIKYNLVEMILSLYLVNISLQLVYYKIFLYIIYWKK